jgi:uncharacterized membrane protein YccC
MSPLLLRRAAIPAGASRSWRFVAPRLDASAAVFALRTLLAVLLALFVAFALDLSRPLWAMLTVFIIAQPFSGAVRSRAVHRFAGTLLGAAFTVLVVPRLSTSPELLCLVLAAWLGACLFLSLLDRSPRSYIFMLAGYTATIIAFSNAEAPGQIFDTALARVEEISVGILCAALAHSILWPRDVSAALNARVTKVLSDADRWLADVVSGDAPGEVPAERRRLATDVSELQVLTHHLGYDTARIRPTRLGVEALLDRLAALPPLAADLEDRLGVIRSGEGADPRFEQLAADIGAWLRAGEAASPDAADELRARAEALETEFQAGKPTWRALLHACATANLADLVQAVSESRELADLLMRRGGRPPRRLQPTRSRRRLHRDVELAAVSGVVSAAILLVACAVWIFSGWPDGGAAATFAGIGCCLFATQDDPIPGLKTLGTYMALGMPLAGVYEFLILPKVDGFVMLGAVLAPAVLVIGYLMGKPSAFVRALPLSLGFASGIGLQARYSANLAAFLNVNGAVLLGLAFAVAAQRVVRVIDAGWNGRRLVRRGWSQVADLARASRPADRLEWLSHALDRLGLITPRLPQPDAAEALRDIRVGLDVIDLQQLRRAASPGLRRQVDAILDEVAKSFAMPRRHAAAALPGALLPGIDRALASCLAEVEGQPRRVGLAALVGLRRNLFPAGPDYQGDAA